MISKKKTISIISEDKEFKAKMKCYLKRSHYVSFPSAKKLLEHIKTHKIDIYLIDENNLKLPIVDLYFHCIEYSSKSKLIFKVSDESYNKYIKRNSFQNKVFITHENFENNYSQPYFFDCAQNKQVDMNAN